MGARGSKRAKARQVEIGRVGLQPRPPGGPRMARTEHRLAQIAIGTAPVGKPALLAHFRSGKCLLGPVIDAGNAKREQLDRDPGDHLVVRGSIRRKAQLLAKDLVVVVEDRYVLVPTLRCDPNGLFAGSKPSK